MIVTGQDQNAWTLCVISWKMRIVYVHVYGCAGDWEGRENSEKGRNDNETLRSLCV